MVCWYKSGGILRTESNTFVRGVNTDDLGRSQSFRIFSWKRPWFRAFHFSWSSFFLAFLGWFSLVPALEYLVEDRSNDIDFEDVKTSSIVAVLGTVFLRLVIGPLCEVYGPKRIQCLLLASGGILVLASASIRTATGLLICRFFIGFIGATFVPCQYWTTMMFADGVVGQANAFAGGWGNLGAGVANVGVAGLIALFQKSGVNDFLAWRLAVIFPGVLLMLYSLPMNRYSDDCPQGAWSKRIYNNEPTDEERSENTPKKMKRLSCIDRAWFDWRVWVLFVQYACCFGIELAINNSMASYFFRNFLSDEGNCTSPEDFASETEFLNTCSILGKNYASMIAGLFGLMNLFARALGGLLSDRANRWFGMRGRLIVQLFCLFMQGTMLIIFSRIQQVGPGILMLILFSVFVQASEGSTFALVPFMCKNIGVVAGIVGAGGNVGAVCWSTLIKAISNTSDAYLELGAIVILSSLLTLVFPVQNSYICCTTSAKSSNQVIEESMESKKTSNTSKFNQADHAISLT